MKKEGKKRFTLGQMMMVSVASAAAGALGYHVMMNKLNDLHHADEDLNKDISDEADTIVVIDATMSQNDISSDEEKNNVENVVDGIFTEINIPSNPAEEKQEGKATVKEEDIIGEKNTDEEIVNTEDDESVIQLLIGLHRVIDNNYADRTDRDVIFDHIKSVKEVIKTNSDLDAYKTLISKVIIQAGNNEEFDKLCELVTSSSLLAA